VVSVFTGLIQDLGAVGALERDGEGALLTIVTPLAEHIRFGDSIAVNGVCLTASDVDESGFSAQAMQETLARSALGDLRPGEAVNLELALAAGDRLGGHIVQGHVDGTGRVSGVREEGFARVLEVDLDGGLARYLVERGSVAVNGVSLTVSALRDDGFAVSLIPETLQRTNLGQLEEGASVNVEVDILAKHVERLLAAGVRV
jgi:riboflavin synthase